MLQVNKRARKELKANRCKAPLFEPCQAFPRFISPEHSPGEVFPQRIESTHRLHDTGDVTR